MTLIRWIDLESAVDERGQLCVAEVGKQIPFPLERVYFLRNTKLGEPRGFHAHKALEQVAVCVAGSCRLILDDGSRREQVVLDDPTRAIYVGPMIWREMHDFTQDCVLLVMASTIYKESDYIRDYQAFVDATKTKEDDSPFIHRLADVSTSHIGARTRVWQFVSVLNGAIIGADCNICANVLIEGGAIVGDRVTVKSGVQVWENVSLEDDTFVGPNVTFTNDPFPRSKRKPSSYPQTVVKKGASIGANATILPGITIGSGAMVGAGAVVVRDVPDGAIVVGNPAKIIRKTVR